MLNMFLISKIICEMKICICINDYNHNPYEKKYIYNPTVVSESMVQND